MNETKTNAIVASPEGRGDNEVYAVEPGFPPSPASWATVFERRAPLRLEIGFGRPHFLYDLAKEFPDDNIIGIEWKKRWVTQANRKVAREGIPNLRALHGNAWHLACALFQPQSVDAMYLNFPDPWWKKKHRKRRVINADFASHLISRLTPQGSFFIQSDVASLLEEILSVLEDHTPLVNVHGPGRIAPKKSYRARSHREKKCSEAGIPIFRARLQMKPSKERS